MLKIFLPYFDPSMQKRLAIYIKWMELQYTIRFFQRFPYATPAPQEMHFDMMKIAEELLPYSSPADRPKLEGMRDMFQTMEQYKSMMEMVQTMKELFPEGEEGGGDLMSGLAAMSGMPGMGEMMSGMAEMMSGMSGMNGMSGMSGMSGMNGMPWTKGMSGTKDEPEMESVSKEDRGGKSNKDRDGESNKDRKKERENDPDKRMRSDRDEEPDHSGVQTVNGEQDNSQSSRAHPPGTEMEQMRQMMQLMQSMQSMQSKTDIGGEKAESKEGSSGVDE
jgi:hypothetical protein